MVLSGAAKYRLSIIQIDVKTAFLYRDLEKPVYMEKQKDVELIDENCDEEDIVFKLKRSIYGLKVSSKIWFLRFKKFITSKGFYEYVFQPCIFT